MPEEMNLQETEEFWSDWWDQMDARRRIEEENDNRRRRKATWFFICVRAATGLFLTLGIIRISRAAHTFFSPGAIILVAMMILIGVQLAFNIKDLKRCRKK